MKRLYSIFFFSIVCFGFIGSAQNKSTIRAFLNNENKSLTVSHKLTYHNTSKDALNELFFLDWANAFSSKETPLAIRFNEDFRRAFHFANDNDRGYITINSVTQNNKSVNWFRPQKMPDILGIKLDTPLTPNQKVTLNFEYTVKIPSDRFTRFGFSKKGYKIKFWHLTPAIYNKEWELYSHKNLNDFSSQLNEYDLSISIPNNYRIESNLNLISAKQNDTLNTVYLTGLNIPNVILFLEQQNSFFATQTKSTVITSDIPTEGMDAEKVKKITNKVVDFVETYVGEIPQTKILLSYKDYLKQPVYGFNQLPKLLRPFKKGFQYEIITLKQLLNEVKKTVFISNLRKDQWVSDGFQIYLLIKYVEKYYPEKKLAGRLHKILGLNWFHASKLKFNDQYYLGYKNIASRFLEQPLGTSKDSLIKFNYNIANPYKAGMGFHYLESYLGESVLDTALIQFVKKNKLKTITAADFSEKLQKSTPKNIDWFIQNFIYEDTKTDVCIKKITKTKDSVFIHLKNKGKLLPVKLSALKKKQKIRSVWTPVFSDSLKIGFPKKEATHYVIDLEERLPEFSRRNNYYKRTGLLQKKLQFRLFQDIEDPQFTQFYTVPVYDFNVYDGLILGARSINKSLTPRNFSIDIQPSYGLKSRDIQGSIRLGYTHQLQKYGWSFLNYSISASTSSFAEGLSFRRYTPSISLSYRPHDLRKNIRQRINARLVSIQRERNANTVLETPNYNVFNTRYSYFDDNLTHRLSFDADYQIARNFSRVSTTFNYRKLFVNNRQINFRFFAGAFLNNDTEEDGDFFSFALDRPSDYLFDFGYFARDDNSGIASQQFITAEGNFKSRFTDRFANQWITSTSFETTLWNWIFVYSNFGVIKSEGRGARSLYDSGIRLNLVQDYFELYFPIQSSLGFEPGFSDYAERIRFKASFSIDTVLKLFTREWY